MRFSTNLASYISSLGGYRFAFDFTSSARLQILGGTIHSGSTVLRLDVLREGIESANEAYDEQISTLACVEDSCKFLFVCTHNNSN